MMLYRDAVVTIVGSGGDIVASVVDGLTDGVFRALVSGDFDGARLVVGFDPLDALNMLGGVHHALLTPTAGHPINLEFVLLHVFRSWRNPLNPYAERRSNTMSVKTAVALAILAFPEYRCRETNLRSARTYTIGMDFQGDCLVDQLNGGGVNLPLCGCRQNRICSATWRVEREFVARTMLRVTKLKLPTKKIVFKLFIELLNGSSLFTVIRITSDGSYPKVISI